MTVAGRHGQSTHQGGLAPGSPDSFGRGVLVVRPGAEVLERDRAAHSDTGMPAFRVVRSHYPLEDRGWQARRASATLSCRGSQVSGFPERLHHRVSGPGNFSLLTLAEPRVILSVYATPIVQPEGRSRCASSRIDEGIAVRWCTAAISPVAGRGIVVHGRPSRGTGVTPRAVIPPCSKRCRASRAVTGGIAPAARSAAPSGRVRPAYTLQPQPEAKPTPPQPLSACGGYSGDRRPWQCCRSQPTLSAPVALRAWATRPSGASSG
jgi:hypothetical protein